MSETPALQRLVYLLAVSHLKPTLVLSRLVAVYDGEQGLNTAVVLATRNPHGLYRLPRICINTTLVSRRSDHRRRHLFLRSLLINGFQPSHCDVLDTVATRTGCPYTAGNRRRKRAGFIRLRFLVFCRHVLAI